MASTYENDLRLEEMATGENSGSWGTKTNTNLELIADAFSYGTETIADADTTLTIADGAADAARSLALKINSSVDLTTTRTVTLAPNTTSKVWIIENNTSGGQTLTISAGSGSNVTLPNGVTKIIATDGIGAAANVTELYTNLHNITVDGTLTVDGILSLADGTNSAPSLTNTGDTNTGLYFPAADEVGITVGGTQVLKADSTGANVTGTLVSDGLTVDGTGLFTSTSAGTVLEIKSTDTGSGSGPDMVFYRQATGSASDVLGKLRFYGQDSSSNLTEYAFFDTSIEDASNGTEDGKITFNVMSGGSHREYLSMVGSSYSVFNDGGLDIDFRVESDNQTHMLFVDAGTDRVGISDSAPTNALSVAWSAAGHGSGFDLRNEQAGGYGGSVTWYSTRSDDSSQSLAAQIMTMGEENWSSAATASSILRFRVAKDSNFYEQLRLSGTNVVINEDSRDTDFRVESDTNTHMLFVDAGSNHVNIGTSTDYGSTLNVFTTGTDALEIVSDNGNANAGPYLDITRKSSSAADGDFTGAIRFLANNDTAETIVASINTVFDDVSNASEDSSLFFRIRQAGAQPNVMDFSPTITVINNDAYDRDFRVESVSNTHALFVDAGSNAVGLMTSSTTSGRGEVGVGGMMYFEPGGTAFQADNPRPSLKRGGDGAFQIAAGSDSSSKVQLYTAPSSGGTLVERLTVMPDGEIRTGGDNSASQTINFRTSSTAGRSVIKGLSRTDSGSVNAMSQLQLMATGASSYIGQFKVVLNGTDTYNSTNQQNCADFRGDSGLVLNQSGYSNLDFRVESDTKTHMLFVDAGADVVMVGTNSPSSPGQEGLKVGDGWTYNSYYFSAGASRSVSFSGEYNYQVEITAMVTPNSGAIGQSRFIAGRRDYSGASHIHATADIVNGTADIAVSTSDSSQTRTYTLTIDHSTDTANLEFLIEVKSKNVGTVTVS